MANEETTTRFKADISELKAAMQEASRQVRLANSEFKAATAGMDSWSNNADGLSAKLGQLNSVLDAEKSKLSNLERQYELTAAEMGENSKAAQELLIKINNQKAVVAKTESDIKKYGKSLDDLGKNTDDAGDALTDLNKDSKNAAGALKDVGDSADKSAKDVDSLGSKLKDLAKSGFAAIGAAAAGAATAFFASAESTREYREDMAKLETAFTSARYTAETATETYKSFFSVLGEEDRSVEAVNHLAKLTSNQEELSQWTDICAGVWGTFGDSLPIEGLTEAANETAKVGQVTGPLADALNWAGVSEDKFNDALTECNSEQERATLITETLNALYSDAAETYKEVNGDIMDAQRAQSELTDTMAEIGAVAEPVMTSLKLLGAEMLTSLLPSIEQLGEGFSDMLNGVDGAGEKVGEGISNIITTALNKVTEMLPTIVEMGLSLVTNLVSGVLSALPQLTTVAIEIINTLLNGLSTAIPDILNAVIEIIPQIIDALMAGLPSFIQASIDFLMGIVDAIPTVIEAILVALPQLITSIVTGLTDAIPQLTDGAVALLMAIVDAIPVIIDLLTQNFPMIIESIINSCYAAVPQLLSAAVKLLMAIIQAIPKITLECYKAVPKIWKAIIEALVPLVENIGNLFGKVIDKVKEWAKNMAAKGKEAGSKFIESVKEFLSNLPYNLGKWLATAILTVAKWTTDFVKKAKEAGKNFVNGVINFIKNVPSNIYKFLTQTLPKIVTWGKDLAKKGKKAATDLFDSIVNKIKNLPKEMSNIGKNLVEGLWNGINDMADWVSKKIKGFSDGVLDGIKDFFGIHSPSKVMKEEVGENLAAGIADGYGDGMKDTTKSASKVNDEFLESLKVDMTDGQKTLAEAAQKEQEKAEKEAAKTAEKLLKEQQTTVDKAFKAQTDAEKEHLKTLSEDLKSITKEYETSLSNIQSEIDSFQSSITNSFSDSLEITKTSDINDKQIKDYEKTIESLKKQADNYAEAYGKDAALTIQWQEKLKKAQDDLTKYKDAHENDDDDEIIGVKATNKISEATRELEEYYNTIQNLKKRGISDELLTELASMSLEEGKAVAEYYETLTDSQLKGLENHWNKYNDTAKKLADELYAGDVKRATDSYFDEVKKRLDGENDEMKTAGYALVKNLVSAFDTKDPVTLEELDRLTGSIDEMLKTAGLTNSPNATDIGKNLVDGIVDGFVSELDASKSTIEDACSSIIDTIKDAFDIHSPSRVMEKLIGNNLMLGLANGIEGKTSAAVDAMKSASKNILSPAQNALNGFNSSMSANGGKLNGINQKSVYNFYQTNNSPKPLSRLEIYRQTKNQIAMLKGV